MTDRLRQTSVAIEEELSGTGLHSQEQLLWLRRSAKAYARGAARCLEATLMVKEMQVRATRLYHGERVQRLRANCLAEAAGEMAKRDPGLGKLVASACAEHRATCPKAKDPHPCPDCADKVAAAVRAHLAWSVPAQRAVTTALDMPVPENGGADRPTEDVFVCAAARQTPNRDQRYTVAVVYAHTEPGTNLFGSAWLTEEGELRTGVDLCAGPHDGAVQAVCRAALDLCDAGSRARVVTRDARAAGVVRSTIRTGAVEELADFPLSDRTLGLLVEVAERRQRISVYADPCTEPHRGAAAVEHLAGLALRAGRGMATLGQVQAEADRIAESLIRGGGTRLASPDEEGEHAWWVGGRTTSDRGWLKWQTALYRMHIDGGWCVLPDGRISGGWMDRQPLQLRLEHRSSDYPRVPPVQEVTLRRRGGQWELSGIRWPAGLLSGVLVTFEWRQGTSTVVARTALLPKPERIDDTEFLHRYDPQVVTRELVPGAEQDRRVPDLSDQSWILRTLRRLGYLSADGVAMLDEEALIRNCLVEGMPRSLLDRLPRAVEQLQRAGRIQRVRGSRDLEGRPWYPARSGDLRVDLLRYTPRIEMLDPAKRRDTTGWPARRGGHWVTGFVRRLPPGAQASAEQIERHRDAIRAAEIVDQPLPEGFTYVRRHHRRR
ncbi:hypothetical protein V6U90_14305 [Micromonospora sp. CPCC 206060]